MEKIEIPDTVRHHLRVAQNQIHNLQTEIDILDGQARRKEHLQEELRRHMGYTLSILKTQYGVRTDEQWVLSDDCTVMARVGPVPISTPKEEEDGLAS